MEFQGHRSRRNLQAYLERGEQISGTYTADLINNFILVERGTKAGNEDAILSKKGGFNVLQNHDLLPSS